MFDLPRTLQAAVARDAGATALVDGERRIDYAELYAIACRLVGAFDELGLKRGDHLVTVLQNRWEAAVLHWACQLVGVIITPINWRASAGELDYVLEDAEAAALVFEAVSTPAVAQSARSGALPRIAVGGAAGGTHAFADVAAAEPADIAGRSDAGDISLMLYTSGTTGRPKGVPRRQRVERAAAVAQVAQHHYRYGERTLGVMPLYHTMGVRALLAGALVNGVFVCLPRFDANVALALIEAERISTLFLVPTLFHDLLAAPMFADTDISSVRNIGFAGASMTDGLLRRLTAAFRPELFVNHYGSSEIYSFTICQDAAGKPGTAGRAGINQEIRVVRIGGGPGDVAAAGEEGEIIATLQGDESFEGYWRRPDADEKALRDGWYFTGDIGYWDADGDLFITGRVDDMVISGGENIMPIEIESLLSLHASVAEVAVAGLPDDRLGQKVAAFIKRAGAVSADELDAYCRQSALADFKRPRDYVFVREIPKSPVGKILRRMLVAGDYEAEGN